MSTIVGPVQPPSGFEPLLENGDRLSRAEFERRYAATPGLKKAELLEGVVFVPSPTRLLRHSHPHNHLGTWLGVYEAATPGTISAANSTVRLDLENELQPDGLLMIDPRCGGQARISTDDYVEQGPELAAEVAASSASYDLHLKMEVYRRNKVLEYLVWRVSDRALDWFILAGDRYERLMPGQDGILRSGAFPGLWLDAPALIGLDLGRVLSILQQGLASADHAAFVTSLARRVTQ